jgi:hypothetical protein
LNKEEYSAKVVALAQALQLAYESQEKDVNLLELQLAAAKQVTLLHYLCNRISSS